MSSFDDLRREIADRHQVVVGHDDPILMLVTVNDYCMKRSLDQLESAHTLTLTLQTQQLERAAQLWLSAAQDTSRVTLDRAAAAIADATAAAAVSAKAAIAESTSTSITALRISIAVALGSSLLSLLACVLLWLR